MVGKDDVVSYILRGLRKWDVDSVTLGNSGVSEDVLSISIDKDYSSIQKIG